MAYRVYQIPSARRAQLDAALGDDTLGRQSITIRDARHFDRNTDHVYLFVEGVETALLRADALILEIGERAPDAAALYSRLKEEEDAAASGLGAIFDH